MRKWINLFEGIRSEYDADKIIPYIVQRIKARGGNEDTDAVIFARQSLERADETISDLFDGRYSLEIYRMITAPRDWQPNLDTRFGIYWTWDRDSAHAYMGNRSDDHIEWLVTAEAGKDDIDWESTMTANASPSSEREREITLKELSWPEIKSIEPF